MGQTLEKNGGEELVWRNGTMKQFMISDSNRAAGRQVPRGTTHVLLRNLILLLHFFFSFRPPDLRSSMDFSQFNAAEQAQMTKVIEKKQV